MAERYTEVLPAIGYSQTPGRDRPPAIVRVAVYRFAPPQRCETITRLARGSPWTSGNLPIV